MGGVTGAAGSPWRLSSDSRAAAATIGAFAAALAVAPIAGGSAGLRTGVATLTIAVLSVVYGRSAAALCSVPDAAPWRRWFELVSGYAGLSLVHLGALVILRQGSGVAFAVDVLGALAAETLRRRSRARVAAPRDDGVAVDAVLLFACALLVVLWARETIGAVAAARATAVFPAWQDYLLHAAEITYLRQYDHLGGTSLYLAGAPQPLYHRASYAVSSLFAWLSGTPSLETATRFWLPTGLLLCTAGICSLGTVLAGRLGGIAAIAAVLLLPDASGYGFANRFLSFHWLMQMAAGSGYAVALVLAGLTLVVVAASHRRLSACGLALALTAAAGAFRVHVAMLAGAMFVVLAAAAWRRRVTRAGLLAALAGAAVAAAVLVALESTRLAPHFLSLRAHPMLFMLSVHTQASAMPSPYVDWTAGLGDVARFGVGYAMLLAAGLGHVGAAVAVALVCGGLRRLDRTVALVVPALLIAHLAVLLLVPTPAHGDVTDFGHRPFVLIYIVFAAITGAAAAYWTGAWSRRRFGDDRVAWLALTAWCLTGVAVPWTIGGTVQQRWTPQYALVPVPADAYEAARHIRAVGSASDVVAASSGDPLALYVALAERPAWLSRANLYSAPGAPDGPLFQHRQAELSQLSTITSFDALVRFGRSRGVAWIVADSDADGQWPDALRRRCSYCGEFVRAYDVR